jgi:hypothetical protein
MSLTNYVLTVLDPTDETEATERHLQTTAFKDPADTHVFEAMQEKGTIYERAGNRIYEIKVTQKLFHGVEGAKDLLIINRTDPNTGTIVPSLGIDLSDTDRRYAEGVKHDAGKPRPTLLVASLAQAVTEVAKVLTYGADKYDDDNWRKVPDGPARYNDALLRTY